MASALRPITMRARIASLFAAASCAGALIAAAPASADAVCENADSRPGVVETQVLRDATLCLLNVERNHENLTPLVENRKLEASAVNYSNAMVREQFFDHVSPEGTTLVERVQAVNYVRPSRGWFVGENIGWGTGASSSPAGMVAAWMASPGHRENIMDGQYRDIGIGIATGTPQATTAVTAGTYTTHFGVRTAKTVKAKASRAKRARAARAKTTHRSKG